MFLEKLESAPSDPLVVTHCTRNDIVLGFLAHAKKIKEVRAISSDTLQTATSE